MIYIFTLYHFIFLQYIATYSMLLCCGVAKSASTSVHELLLYLEPRLLCDCMRVCVNECVDVGGTAQM